MWSLPGGWYRLSSRASAYALKAEAALVYGAPVKWTKSHRSPRRMARWVATGES